MSDNANLARAIARQLNQNLTSVSPEAQARLRLARQRALAAYREPAVARHSLLVTPGGEMFGHIPDTPRSLRFWLPLLALLLMLTASSAWQTYNTLAGDVEEIDAALLAGDLPINAYLDDGFEEWLQGSPQRP